ncbi:MAG: tRNA pseudouridine(55) synthase TruB [Acidothermaceae bacterium]
MAKQPGSPPPRGGLVVVDKPGGMTSHDVVARVRRFAGTRRVGHAGTLDPMATGVLLVGIGRATRLLGHLSLHDKRYLATARLGQTTSSDDAEGVLIESRSGASITADDVKAAATAFVGEIEQRPPAVSAIKVDGKRAYALARAGTEVVLASRKVVVTTFNVLDVRAHDDVVDVDLDVTCSSGTYIRALARDLGDALGVGGHLTALRRTRVGAFELSQSKTLTQLEESFVMTSLDEVAAATFARRDLDEAQSLTLSHGGRLSASEMGDPPVAAFSPRGVFLALLEDRGELACPIAVFVD